MNQHPLIHWSRICHDWIVAAVAGGAVGLSLTTVEVWLKILVLVLSIVFVVQGIVMRHLKLRQHDKQKDKDDGEETD